MSNAVQKIEDAQTPAVSESAAIIQVIERAASNPDVDVDKMDRLLQMQERIMDRNAKQAFSAAMVDAQTEIHPVVANANNSQTKSRYATFDALDAIVRPIYTKHGFAPSFGTADSPKENHVRVTCDLLHRDGHEKHYYFDMPADGKGAKGGDVMTKTHAAASAMSYGQRYLLKGMFNIVIKGEDDDGNKAGAATLNEGQLQTLRERMDEVGADIPAFCKYMGVEKIADISQCDLAKAHQALNAKGSKNASS